MSNQSFQPPSRILMGPGPSDVSPRVLEAVARPTIGHLDPAFVAMMDELRDLLRRTFLTRNEVTFPVSGPGSAGMETCFVNLVEPGDTVVVCVNGVFGGRMVENVERCGGNAVVVEDAWGESVDAAKLESTLHAHPEANLVSFVHAETSTGAASDVEALARIAHAHDCLVIADTVTSLGGIPVRVDDWGLDAVYSGTQKCLSCVPGLSPVTFGARAMERVRARQTKVQSWFLDLNLVLGYWGDGVSARAYHHTAPINSLVALHEALLILLEEGLEVSWRRHHQNHLALRAGLEAMGLTFLVDESCRLPQLNAVRVPEGVDEMVARRELLEMFGLEIGAGLGPFAGKVWRIGLMGHSSHPENVYSCLKGLGTVLAAQGIDVEDGTGAARAVYEQ